jgi:hypothetical protein
MRILLDFNENLKGDTEFFKSNSRIGLTTEKVIQTDENVNILMEKYS